MVAERRSLGYAARMTAHLDAAPLLSAQALAQSPEQAFPRYDGLEHKRQVIQQRMAQEFDALLCPLGFQRKGSRWRKASAHGEIEFYFQKGKWGTECFLNVAVRRAGNPHKTTEGANGFSVLDVRMGDFCPELPSSTRPDGLSYVRLHDEPAFHRAVMRVFAARMVPWMMVLHQPRPAPAPVQKIGFLARLFSVKHTAEPMPARYPRPEEMRSIPLFSDV